MKKCTGGPGVTDDLDTRIKKAQAQPGIAELARAYGGYEDLVERSRAYLARVCGTKKEEKI